MGGRGADEGTGVPFFPSFYFIFPFSLPVSARFVQSMAASNTGHAETRNGELV